MESGQQRFMERKEHVLVHLQHPAPPQPRTDVTKTRYRVYTKYLD